MAENTKLAKEAPGNELLKNLDFLEKFEMILMMQRLDIAQKNKKKEPFVNGKSQNKAKKKK